MPPCPHRPLPWAIISAKLYVQRHTQKVRSLSDSPSVARAKGYRAEAKRLREQALEIRWPDLRLQVEEIARQYELLADNVERKHPG